MFIDHGRRFATDLMAAGASSMAEATTHRTMANVGWRSPKPRNQGRPVRRTSSNTRTTVAKGFKRQSRYVVSYRTPVFSL